MHPQKTVLQADQEIGGKRTEIRTERGEIGTEVTGRGHAVGNVGDRDPGIGNAGRDPSPETAPKEGKQIS